MRLLCQVQAHKLVHLRHYTGGLDSDRFLEVIIRTDGCAASGDTIWAVTLKEAASTAASLSSPRGTAHLCVYTSEPIVKAWKSDTRPLWLAHQVDVIQVSHRNGVRCYVTGLLKRILHCKC